MSTEVDWGTRYHLIQLAKLDNQLLSRFGKVLSESNPILRDMPIYPSNQILGYTGMRETSLPTPQIVKVGDGHSASKVEWDAFSEVISMFKDRVDIPRDALRLQKDQTAKRLLILDRHEEGFGQGVVNHLINGTSIASPEKFDGLGVRYNTPDSTNPLNPSSSGDYGVWDMGGTGDDTSSIFMVQWAEDKVCGICPQNDPNKGIRVRDKGLVYVSAENSKDREDYRTELEWDLGLCVSDYRAVNRIRNIETAITNISTNLWKYLVQARNSFKGSEPVFIYVSPGIFNHLDILSVDKQNVRYTSDNIWGKPLMMWRDCVVGKCDCISDAETAVAAA